MHTLDMNVGLLETGAELTVCSAANGRAWPSELSDVVHVLGAVDCRGAWLDAAVVYGRDTYHVALSPLTSALGTRVAVALRGPAGQDQWLRASPRPHFDLQLQSGPPIGRHEVHDLKTLLAAALLGLEVARNGDPATGSDIAEQAIRRAMLILAPVEDPSMPTDLRPGGS